MNVRTKLLILASAGLLALSLAACNGDTEESEKASTGEDKTVADVNTTAQENEEMPTEAPQAEESREAASSEAHETEAQQETVEEIPRETTEPATDEQESEGSAIGPLPPITVETEPKNDEVVTMPPMEGMDTDDIGDIVLPFVPYD